jgi:hypothetical protein
MHLLGALETHRLIAYCNQYLLKKTNSFPLHICSASNIICLCIFMNEKYFLVCCYHQCSWGVAFTEEIHKYIIGVNKICINIKESQCTYC